MSQPKMVRLPRNEKQTYRLNSRSQMRTMGLTLVMTLTFEFSRWNVTLTFDHMHGFDQGYLWSNFEIAVSQNGWTDWHLTKEVGGRSFMTMTVTIWWPRSGVRIYQIVTRVTSDVDVSSTHLTCIDIRILHISYRFCRMVMDISLYPMLRADSRFWLVNNREIWSRISRLTSSAWDIKTKERHWWRHIGDSDHRPLSLPLRYDLVTLYLYDDLGQINVKAGILKLRNRFRMSQILFEHGIIRYPLFASADTGIYPLLASQYHAWPSAARGIAMLRVDKFPYPRQQTRGN